MGVDARVGLQMAAAASVMQFVVQDGGAPRAVALRTQCMPSTLRGSCMQHATGRCSAINNIHIEVSSQ
jgi:hypothetical protein